MKSLILVFLIGVFALSCDKKQSREDEQTRLEKANALMGRADYDGAIRLLEDLKKSKHGPQVPLTLASAYAARAGVRVEKYWGFLVGEKVLGETPAQPSEDLPIIDPKTLPANLPAEVKAAVENLNKNLLEADRIRRRVRLLPYVEYEKRADLSRAVEVLTEVPTQGGHLYRGILEAILFRSAAADIVKLSAELIKNPEQLCTKKLTTLIDWLDYSQKILDHFFADGAEAFPKKNLEFKRLREDLQKWGGLLEQIGKTVDEQGSALCALRF